MAPFKKLFIHRGVKGKFFGNTEGLDNNLFSQHKDIRFDRERRMNDPSSCSIFSGR